MCRTLRPSGCGTAKNTGPGRCGGRRERGFGTGTSAVETLHPRTGTSAEVRRSQGAWRECRCASSCRTPKNRATPPYTLSRKHSRGPGAANFRVPRPPGGGGKPGLEDHPPPSGRGTRDAEYAQIILRMRMSVSRRGPRQEVAGAHGSVFRRSNGWRTHGLRPSLRPRAAGGYGAGGRGAGGGADGERMRRRGAMVRGMGVGVGRRSHCGARGSARVSTSGG